MVLAGSVLSAQAQEVQKDSTVTPSSSAVITDADREGKQLIKTEELPEAIKQTLEDQEYKGWVINAAYFDKKEEQYEVELKNGAETQRIKFSHEGQRLDD